MSTTRFKHRNLLAFYVPGYYRTPLTYFRGGGVFRIKRKKKTVEPIRIGFFSTVVVVVDSKGIADSDVQTPWRYIIQYIIIKRDTDAVCVRMYIYLTREPNRDRRRRVVARRRRHEK